MPSYANFFQPCLVRSRDSVQQMTILGLRSFANFVLIFQAGLEGFSGGHPWRPARPKSLPARNSRPPARHRPRQRAAFRRVRPRCSVGQARWKGRLLVRVLEEAPAFHSRRALPVPTDCRPVGGRLRHDQRRADFARVLDRGDRQK